MNEFPTHHSTRPAWFGRLAGESGESVELEAFGHLFRCAAGFDEITAQRADPIWRAFMFARAFSLCFIGENHFTYRFAT